MPIVFDNIELPGTTYDVRARVDVYLVASADDSTVPGIIPGSDVSILDKETGYTNGAGYVQFDLRANGLITPGGTYYVWETHLKDGRVNKRYISVPNGAGPYHVADLEILTPSPPALFGTWAEMQAVPSPTIGQRWFTTDQYDAEYVYNVSLARWRLACLKPGEVSPLEYGADPTGASSSRTAFLNCITAATTSINGGTGPYGDGNLYNDKIIVTAGMFKIDGGSITFASGADIVMEGISGGGHNFLFGRAPWIVFTTGGFVTAGDVSHQFSLKNLGIYSASGTALTASGAACPGDVERCYFRGTGAGNPAVKLTDGFWGNFTDCVFDQYTHDGTPSVIIEWSVDAAAPNYSWLFRFTRCRFNNAGVRYDLGATHSTVVGAGTVFDECDTENFLANSALLHIRNVHATDTIVFYDVVMRSCTLNDTADPTDYVKVETLGTGFLQVNSIAITNCQVGGSGNHVRFVQTGAGNPFSNATTVIGAQPAISFATANGSGAIGQVTGWDFRGDRTTSVGMRGRVGGDSQDRWRLDAAGVLSRGFGSATPDRVNQLNAGTPESAVTSNIGGVVADSTNGDMYVKRTGTGNTGWLRMIASTYNGIQQNTAGTSFIDWSRAQLFLVGNGGATTATFKQNGTQTASLMEFTSSANAVLSKFNKDGYFMTRKTAAPADGDLATSELAIWFDDTAGAANLKIKAKDAGGTVRNGTLALA